MPPERAGYTVTMFLIDVSASMGDTRIVELSPGPNGEESSVEMTNLQWALQFVKIKIQEMIYNGRKTDQCGVVIFGSDDTDNCINEEAKGGYENVVEYLPIEHPTPATLARIDELEPSKSTGDPIDGIIVASTVQAEHLSSKSTWTRKLVVVTDGRGPMELEDWEATADKLNDWNVGFTLVGVDFDSDEPDYIYEEENKPDMKKINEAFFHEFVERLDNGFIGTCGFALQEVSRPDVKETKSVLSRGALHIGDSTTRPEEAIIMLIRTSKCTAQTRPASWGKYTLKQRTDEDDEDTSIYIPTRLSSKYVVDIHGLKDKDGDGDVKMGESTQTQATQKDPMDGMEEVEKETLVRGYKYGTTYIPAPDGEFDKLKTTAGMAICGFFHRKHFRRELSMGEIQYVWGEPENPNQQVAMSSLVRGMMQKKVYAIARWVSKDERAPKMGVLSPVSFEEVDCLIWAPMPFADDVRKYTFPSLDNLHNKKGEPVTEHPFIPTSEQQDAMDNFVDAMDLMAAGEKDEEGNREPWFDPRQSFNPALHRIKQAMFHSAVVNDLNANPIPAPHPEVVKYMEPPRRMLKRARDEIEACKAAFKVREVPKKVAKTKKDGHAHARDDDDDTILLDKVGPAKAQSQIHVSSVASSSSKQPVERHDSETEDEDEDDELLLDQVKKVSTPPPSKSKGKAPLPTPARSPSPADVSDVEVDRGVETGRIVGSAYPLRDFNKNLEAKDLVTKAVEDLAYVVIDVVMKPFASKRHAEMIECMYRMREVCLTEDEIDAWNEFLVALREKCKGSPGNAKFWSELKAIGRDISLISESEAEKHGGESDYSESKAKKFFIS
ncbi:SPOC domain-like protein, partial [Cylindrobasidium torrendii FP15055 ss-10]